MNQKKKTEGEKKPEKDVKQSTDTVETPPPPQHMDPSKKPETEKKKTKSDESDRKTIKR